MNLRKSLRYVLVVVGIGSIAAYAFLTPLSLAIAKRVVANHMVSDAVADLPDGLHVGLCGAGSPLSDDKRGGPCTLVVAGKRLFVFDAGSASSRNIGKMGFSQGRIDAIFLTHFHSDHIDGFGELMLQRWASVAHTTPVSVYGPTGVETVVAGFMQAYALDRHYRVAHHGEKTVPPSGFGGMARPFVTGADGRVVVLKDADLEIVAFDVDHAPAHPAVGYSIRYKGRSVVLSGDTKKADSVQREAMGVDLLVHEALSTPLVQIFQEGAGAAGRENLQKVFLDITSYHTSPEQAAEIARDAQVGMLLLNHIVPPLPLPGMEKDFLGNATDIYGGSIRVGKDGDFVSLPVGSKQMSVLRRF